MEYPVKRMKIHQGIYFNSISDNRFKTNRITVNLIVKLNDLSVSQNALIPFILRKGYKKIPEYIKLNQKLEELYSAFLDCDVRKVGEYQVISLSISAIDSRYAYDKENMEKEITEIISGILILPLIDRGLFQKSYFEVEKQNLIDTIESEINDKRSFAINRLYEIMFAQQPTGINKYGSVQNVKDMANKHVAQAFMYLLKHARIEVLFIGCGNSEVVFDILKQDFSKLERDQNIDTIKMLPKAASPEVKQKSNNYSVSQSKLAIGFTTGVDVKSFDMYALRLAVTIYGGTPSSKLFLNVREKMGLCYYCASRLDRANGCMIVDSGVEPKNIEKAIQAIQFQFDDFKAGNFTQSDIENAKLSLINSLNSISDSASMLENWYLQQILFETNQSPFMESEKINSITKEQIEGVVKNIKIDTIYSILPIK